MITYGLQYSDKTSLAAGVVFGLREDTHLTGNQYNDLNSFFCECYPLASLIPDMAYALAQLPMGWAMQHFPLGKALAVSIILWGGMVMALGGCNHYWDLSLVRVLLGWFEAVVTPGFAVLTASWYLRKEQTLCQGFYFSMNTFFGIVFGIGIYFLADNAQKHGGLAAWRVINLFLGGLTVGMGIIFLIFVGTPDEVWWLSKREKLMAKARIVSNSTGGGETHPWKWSQVNECFKDRQFYHALAYNFLSCVPNGGLGAFNSLIYRSMGFTPLETILYGMPNQAITFTLVLAAATAVRYRESLRFPIGIMGQIVPIIVFLYVGLANTGKWHKWAAFSFYGLFSITTFMVWPLMSVNIAGRTKKTFFAAASLVSYCAGNIVGTQIFVPKDAPKYIGGLIGCAACMCLNVVNLGLWLWYYRQENRKREQFALESGLTHEEQEKEGRVGGEMDMTDRENMHFVSINMFLLTGRGIRVKWWNRTRL